MGSEKDLFDKDDVKEDDWLAAPRPLSVDASAEDTSYGMSIWGATKLILGLALLGGVIAAWFLYSRAEHVFPRLEDGAYRGLIEGISTEPAVFYLEKRSTSDSFVAWVLREGWEPAVMSAFTRPAEGKDALKMSGPDGDFMLFGVENGPGRFEGTIKDVNGKKSGSWKFTRMPDDSPPPDPSLRLWLLFNADLRGVEKRLAELESRIPEQKKEIVKLTTFIEAKEGLKANADKKFEEEKGKAEKLRQELAQRESSVDALQKKVDLAYRVTDMGKLVSLARESIEKDRSWVKSQLKGSGEVETPELNESYDKAKRIVTLRRQIAEENDKIYSFLHPNEPARGGAPE